MHLPAKVPRAWVSLFPDVRSLASLPQLPRCASKRCRRPPSLWQRWWARNEGTWFEERWYCSSECLRDALWEHLELGGNRPRYAARRNVLPLGLVLLSRDMINSCQLQQALAKQRRARKGRIGEWLVKMGAVSEDQVTGALAIQQGCPIFSSAEPQFVPAWLHWPKPLAMHYGAVPVYHNSAQGALYVGFLETVNHGFLYAVEHLLRCRTEVCILPPASFRRHLEWEPAPGEAETIEICQAQSSAEMADTIANYAQQATASRCGMAVCDASLWTRLERQDRSSVDFLFHL